ncbi:MAG: pseudouridine synthase [Candidatus Uhrbacteria bacterium]|nr:pseudouridine synthase [Candidatus Uhrbacteria bacterium]
METRINKFLADRGIASRRAIDELIAQKRIAVNGAILEQPGVKVSETDVVTVDGKQIEEKMHTHEYVLFNKPADCITTASDTHGRKTVLDYVKIDVRVFPVGRLDKNTTGVLLLTNDGDLANMLMHPRYSVEKVYRVGLDKLFTERDRKRFEGGIMLDDKKTAPCKAQYFHNEKRDIFVTLHEGRNRQIRRMFNALGYAVEKLDRTSYAGLTAGRLKRGEWRYLTKKEVDMLRKRFQMTNRCDRIIEPVEKYQLCLSSGSLLSTFAPNQR